jgi:outer membrane protein OmpA-like peptidoglycan-associated protein
MRTSIQTIFRSTGTIFRSTDIPVCVPNARQRIIFGLSQNNGIDKNDTDKNVCATVGKTAIMLFCALLIFALPLSAQKVDSSARTRFGVFGQFAYNMHRAAFANLPGVPTCCPQFTDAVSNSYALGALFDIPLNNVFGFSLRLGYTPTPASFFTIDSRPEKLTINTTGEAEPSFTRHYLTAANMSNAGLEALFTIKPLTGSTHTDDGLTILMGARAGYVLFTDYRQYERTANDSISFADPVTRKPKGIILNDYSGSLPSVSPYAISLMGGLAWEIPLNAKRTVYITPEVFYSFPLTPVIPSSALNGSWSVHQIRAGIALKFAPERKVIDTSSAPPQTPPDSPPVVIGTPTTKVENKRPPETGVETGGKELSATLTAVGVERDGKELPDVTFRVEEFLSTNLRPLLPYVFFEQGSDNIPERYDHLSMRDVNDFQVDKLHNYEMLETYHHIMNIVGRRMRSYPRAKLTITGCNDNTAPGERGNTSLSYRRAKAVRDYLSNVWNIDTARMPIQVRNLPATPTVSNTKLYDNEVVQENRRTEFSSDTWEILEPIKTTDTVRTVSPPIIRFRPRVMLPQGNVKEWRITIRQDGQKLKEFWGTGNIPAILDWNLAENQATIPRAPTPLEYTLSVVDDTGNRLSAQGASPVEQITIQRKRRERLKDREVDRYSLILFDFDKSNLTTTQNRIASFIKTQIQPEATVRISGYTDYTNPLDYSLRLSKARARETASALDLIKKAEVRGLGKTVLLYDTEIPEGRFYCRTVTIIVETPIVPE